MGEVTSITERSDFWLGRNDHGVKCTDTGFLWDLFLCLQFPRSDAKSHSQTHVESHMNLALRGLEANQHQVHELVTVVKDQSERIELQSGQIEQQSQQIERLISKDKKQSQQTERQSGQIKRQSQQIERLMSKDKEQTEQIDQQSRQIER